jgi:hypothetical protein
MEAWLAVQIPWVKRRGRYNLANTHIKRFRRGLSISRRETPGRYPTTAGSRESRGRAQEYAVLAGVWR